MVSYLLSTLEHVSPLTTVYHSAQLEAEPNWVEAVGPVFVVVGVTEVEVEAGLCMQYA